jgi:hypothetical protein
MRAIACYRTGVRASTPSLTQPVRFREEQRFRQVWIWILILPLCVGMGGFFGWAMVEQLVRGRVVGDQPMPDLMLMILGPLFIALSVGLLWLMWAARLTTEVRDDGIYIRFHPFHRGFRGFLWEDIESIEACTYRPILEYGGWGIRSGSTGTAYNVSGNKGLQLDLGFGPSGRVLIGSQRPGELAVAVESARGESRADQLSGHAV